MDNQTGEIISQKTHTIRSPDGSSKTIKTIEKIKNGEIETENRVGEAKLMKIEEMMKIDDVDEDTIEESFPVPNVIGDINNTEKDLKDLEGKVVDDSIFSGNDHKSSGLIPNFDNLISFLKPANELVQKVIEETTLNNPALNQELLSLDFKVLLKVFQQIFVQSDSIETAYRTLFEGVGQVGAERYVDNFFKNQNLKKGDIRSTQAEEIVDKFVKRMSGDGKNIAEMLGSEKVNELVGEYVKNIEFQTLEQNPDQLAAAMEKMLKDLEDSTSNTRSKISP